MGPLWAVAAITFKEAVRKKVFMVVIIFTIIILASTALFPVIDPAQQLHLVILWTQRILTFFAAIMIVFTAGTSLPGDVDSKRIHTILSKPVHKMTFITGKFLGFALVLLAFIAAMGVSSMIYMTVLQLVRKDHTQGLQARPVITAARLRAEGKVWERKGTEDDPGKFLEARTPGVERPTAGMIDSPVRTQYRIAGRDSSITWIFTGLDPDDFPPEVQVETRFMVNTDIAVDPKEYKAVYRGRAKIQVIHPGTRKMHELEHHFSSKKSLEITFPRDLISPSGELHIRVSRGTLDPASPERPYITAEANHVILYGASRNFWVNYSSGMILVFLQSLIVMSGTMLFASFVSAPVSIFFGLFLFFAGSIHTYNHQSVKHLDRTMEHRLTHALDPRVIRFSKSDELPIWVMKYGRTVSDFSLTFLPNFDHFDFSKYLQKDLALTAGTVGAGALHSFPFVIVFFGLSLLVIRFKDFA